MKNKQRIITLVAVLGFLLITAGVTYAFFSYSKAGTTENTVSSGAITFLYDEINQSGNSIGITDAMPISDVSGKAQFDAFNFKIVSTTNNNTAIPYEITLRQKEGTDDIGNIVKIYLSKTGGYSDAIGNEQEVITSTFSSLQDVVHNDHTEKQLYTTEVPKNSNSYNQYYRLKMWIDESTNYSPVENSTTGELEYPYNNKTFTVMVNVYATGRIISSNSNITSMSVNNSVLTAVSTNTYETTLPPRTEQTDINVQLEDSYSEVSIVKTQSDYTTVVGIVNNIQKVSNSVTGTTGLTVGDNYFKILVNSESNQNNKEIHLKITVEESPTLGDMILANNTLITASPTLNTSANETSDANGLYRMNVTNGFGGQSIQGTTYYFRGNVNNNKVSFANKMWRIIRINEDGTIRLILEDSTDGAIHRYASGYNDMKYLYYSNSLVKSYVETWYNQNITGTNASKVATGNYFCEAAKVKYDRNWNAGSATMTYYINYTPNLVCATDGNSKGLLNNTIGLITYDELILAGGYPGKDNKSYYLYKNISWWSMSAAGSYSSNSTRGWFISTNGNLSQNFTDSSFQIRPVINLKADVEATYNSTAGYYVVN